MSIQLGSAYGSIEIDTSGAKASVDGFVSQMNSIGQSMQRIGGGLSLAVTAPLTAFGVKSVGLATDLDESMNKIGVVFDEQAATIAAWSQGSAEQFGLSQQEALEAAGTFGNLFDSMGVDSQGAADMSTALVQLAGDLASFNNIDPTEALAKLQSGIVGETEPLRALGVNLSAAAVEAQAMAMGLGDAGGVLSEQDKITARYALIMEQTANAQGDFSRTSDGLANSQRILQADLANLGAELGATLVPVVQSAVEVVSQLVNWFQNLSPGVQRTIVAFGAAAAVAGPLLMALGTMVTAASTLAPILGAVAGAVSAISAPVWIAAAAIGGLAAILFDWGGANEKVAETLEGWGLTGVADGVRSLHEGVEGIIETVGQLINGETSFADIFAASAPDWLLNLSAWTWPTPETPDWIQGLFDWQWTMPTVPDWLQTLFDWAWPFLGPVAWVVKLTDVFDWPELTVPEWVETLFLWAWPDFSPIDWIVTLTGWGWPSLSKPGWIQNLLDFDWPSFPSLPGWLGGRGDDADQNAMGTSFFRGGATWVGEQGPELIELPRGTKIFDNNESMRMAGAAAGGIQVNFYNTTVTGDADIDNLARRVVRRIQWQQR